MAKFVEVSGSGFKAAGFETLSSRTLEVGEHAAREYVYTGSMAKQALKFRALAVEQDDDHVLLFTCASLAKDFDEYDDEFAAALASVKLDE